MNNILNLIGRTKNLFEDDIKALDKNLKEIVSSSSFLVIGGAGSIGSAVTKEIFIRDPIKLYVVDISENNLVELVRDIRSEFGYINGDFEDFAKEIAMIKGMKHDSPYHAEDVDTHIQMTIDGAKAQEPSTYYTKDEIVTLAELHDLGKGITKKPSNSRGVAHDYFVEVHGSHSMFANHQYVGAMYALVKFKDDLSESHLKVVEAIYQHMKAHDGISAKAIKKDKLDEDTVALIEDFAKIDSASRIIDEAIYEKYMSLLGKKG